jgi:hypothetical protein
MSPRLQFEVSKLAFKASKFVAPLRLIISSSGGLLALSVVAYFFGKEIGGFGLVTIIGIVYLILTTLSTSLLRHQAARDLSKELEAYERALERLEKKLKSSRKIGTPDEKVLRRAVIESYLSTNKTGPDSENVDSASIESDEH